MWHIEFISTECIVVYNVFNDTNYNILHLIKSSIVFYTAILKNINTVINYTLFENFVYSIEY